MIFFNIVASPLRGALKLSTTQSSPEQVNQQCQNDTDDHHGRYGYEYNPALSLDAYITRQAAKPAEGPGCELEYSSNDQQHGTGNHDPFRHVQRTNPLFNTFKKHQHHELVGTSRLGSHITRRSRPLPLLILSARSVHWPISLVCCSGFLVPCPSVP